MHTGRAGTKIILLPRGVAALGYGVGKGIGGLKSASLARRGITQDADGTRSYNTQAIACKDCPMSGTLDEIVVTGKKIASDYLNSFILTGSAVLAPLINQANTIWNEGIHEGGAYDRNLNVMRPYSLDNWQFNSHPEYMQDDIPYSAGKKLLSATTDVSMGFIPLKPVLKTGSPFINKYGPKAVDFGAKYGIKQSRNYIFNLFGE
jgi:hypothetical protein